MNVTHDIMDGRIIAAAMWDVVDRHVGKVGYKGAVKAEGLARSASDRLLWLGGAAADDGDAGGQ